MSKKKNIFTKILKIVLVAFLALIFSGFTLDLVLFFPMACSPFWPDSTAGFRFTFCSTELVIVLAISLPVWFFVFSKGWDQMGDFIKQTYG